MARDVVVIHELTSQDLEGMTRIHRAAFPDSALTKLGAEAVRRYYQWLIEGPHQAAKLGAFVGTEIAGFCLGGVFQGAMSGFLRQNRLYLSSRVLMRPWIVANPIFRERIFRALRILKKFKGTSPSAKVDRPSTKPFGILAIAVNPKRQGLGLGKLLMQEAENIACQQGFREMILTVSTFNHQAIKFYENLQWVKVFNNSVWEGGMKKSLDATIEARILTPNRLSQDLDKKF